MRESIKDIKNSNDEMSFIMIHKGLSRRNTMKLRLSSYQAMTKNAKDLDDYEDAPVLPKDYIKIEKNKKYGLEDKNGNLIIPCAYDIVEDFNQFGIAKVMKDNKWGLYGKESVEGSHEITGCKYDLIGRFFKVFSALQEAKFKIVALVKREGRWGILEKNGELVIQPSYNTETEAKNVLTDYMYSWPQAPGQLKIVGILPHSEDWIEDPCTKIFTYGPLRDFAVGDLISIEGVKGMDQINNLKATILDLYDNPNSNKNNNSGEKQNYITVDIDSSSFKSWIKGGRIKKVKPKTSLSTTAHYKENPVKLKIKKVASDQDSKAKRIAELNDALRTMGVGGEIMITRGISALPESMRSEVIEKVRNFNVFTEGNDPYGEHDMGMFKVEGQSFMWKIDYYDLNLQYGSPDPSDPSVTKRVLTIMLSSEY